MLWWDSKLPKHGGRGMIVASSLDLGKSDALQNLADDLNCFVQRAVREGASLDEVERGAFQRLLKMGQVAVDLFLAGQGNGDLGGRLETEEGTVLYRSETV